MVGDAKRPSENRRTRIGRKVLRVVGPACLILGLVVVLVPFSVTNETFGIEDRSCGSVLFPTYDETFSGENAVLVDWVTERDCRAETVARVWVSIGLVLVGGFLTVAAYWPSGRWEGE